MAKETSGRNSQLNRPIKILEMLLFDQKALGKREIGAELGLGATQADRVFGSVREMRGVVTRKDGRRHVLSFDFSTLINGGGFGSAVAACFGRSLSYLFEGSSYEEDLANATDSVIQACRERDLFKDVDRKFIHLPMVSDPAVQGEILDEIVKALLEEKIVRVEYKKLGKKRYVKKELRPLSLAIYEHQLYLVARECRTRMLRPKIYRLSRARAAKCLRRRFTYPNDYDPRTLFQNSIGVFLAGKRELVRVRLSGSWADYAESHVWHPSQSIEDEGDGSRVLVPSRVICEI